MLTPEQIKTYYEDGVLVVKDLIKPEDLSRYRDAYERMVEKVRACPDPRTYNARVIGQAKRPDSSSSGVAGEQTELWGADWLLHPDLYEPEFTEYLENEKLLAIMRTFLGPDLEIYGLKALWSPVKVTYDLAWHRDGRQESFVPDGIPPGWLQFNTALYREESFRVVRGSHRRALTEEEQAKYGTTEPVANEEICVLEPGAALFMHQAVLHRGKAEPEPKRRALHYILASSDFAAGRRRVAQFKSWYAQLGLADTLGPLSKPLFENFLAWEGRAFDDIKYPYPLDEDNR